MKSVKMAFVWYTDMDGYTSIIACGENPMRAVRNAYIKQFGIRLTEYETGNAFRWWQMPEFADAGYRLSISRVPYGIEVMR